MTLHSDSLPVPPKASRQGPSNSTQLLISQSHNSGVQAGAWGASESRKLGPGEVLADGATLVIFSFCTELIRQTKSHFSNVLS